MDLLVAASGVLLAPELRQRVPDRLAGRMPERRARAELREREQVELAAELAVVPRAGLLEPLQVRGELLGAEKNAVPYTRVSIVLAASPRQYAPATDWSLNAPIRLVDGACGPAAEVGEVAVRVQADRLDALVADEVLDQLDLVVLALA